ncbi:MAG: DNA recombination protein RmuC, partial [Bacteriovoracaceae bacterium]
MEIVLFFLGLLLGLVFHFFRSQKLNVLLKVAEQKQLIQLEEHQKQAKQLEERLSLLSHKIVDEKSRLLQEESLKQLDLYLKPFKEKLFEFESKVEEIHEKDLRDRVKLQTEIERLGEVSRLMGQETANLTKALKGDAKVQGNWGEMILERILESSGLRRGEEFILQGEGMGLRSEDGRVQMPDAIIMLPEDKHLIVDAKVTLTSYERFVSDPNEGDLSLFLDSLYGHIKNLSDKNYHLLDKLITPDYVMLFVPIEGAFMLAMQKDHEIFEYAWDKNIVLVGPSTLLATLKTVSSLWRQQRQTKNSLEIARQAGALYDKFVAVAADLDQMDQQVGKLHESLVLMRSRMLNGRGSVASRMEKL